MRIIPTAALLLSALAFAQAPGPKPVPDKALGLSRTSVFEVPSPPTFQDEASAPGEKALPPRVNRENPPVIPHGLQDMLPITRGSNLCLDCHGGAGPKKKGDPTPAPASHYVDYRREPGKRGKAIAGTRWVCTACHVPRSDAQPLVGSTFRR